MLTFKLLTTTGDRLYGVLFHRSLTILVAASLIYALFIVHGITRQLPPGVKIPQQIFLMNSSELLVISLPNRQDRRRDMERLRLELGLQWSYFDALTSESPLVAVIMGWVEKIRASEPFSVGDNRANSFSWPENLENIANSIEEISMWSDGHNPWDLSLTAAGFPPSTSYRRVVCAIKNCTIPTGFLSEHMILTPSRVACWHSHLSVIHKLANSLGPRGPGVAMILEDDVDMEKDIGQKTRALWRTLPDEWDIVFLGEG